MFGHSRRADAPDHQCGSTTHRPAGDLETEERLSRRPRVLRASPAGPCARADGRQSAAGRPAARAQPQYPPKALPEAPPDVAASIGAAVGRPDRDAHHLDLKSRLLGAAGAVIWLAAP